MGNKNDKSNVVIDEMKLREDYIHSDGVVRAELQKMIAEHNIGSKIFDIFASTPDISLAYAIRQALNGTKAKAGLHEKFAIKEQLDHLTATLEDLKSAITDPSVRVLNTASVAHELEKKLYDALNPSIDRIYTILMSSKFQPDFDDQKMQIINAKPLTDEIMAQLKSTFDEFPSKVVAAIGADKNIIYLGSDPTKLGMQTLQYARTDIDKQQYHQDLEKLNQAMELLKDAGFEIVDHSSPAARTVNMDVALKEMDNHQPSLTDIQKDLQLIKDIINARNEDDAKFYDSLGALVALVERFQNSASEVITMIKNLKTDHTLAFQIDKKQYENIYGDINKIKEMLVIPDHIQEQADIMWEHIAPKVVDRITQYILMKKSDPEFAKCMKDAINHEYSITDAETKNAVTNSPVFDHMSRMEFGKGIDTSKAVKELRSISESYDIMKEMSEPVIDEDGGIIVTLPNSGKQIRITKVKSRDVSKETRSERDKLDAFLYALYYLLEHPRSDK